MDSEIARFNMIESQVRTWEVLDQAVLDLLHEVKREEFVPPQYRALAFTDMEIPLGHGEVMLTPKMEARMLQELTLSKADRVLEIGTGSGYVTALLARLAGQVVSVQPRRGAQACRPRSAQHRAGDRRRRSRLAAERALRCDTADRFGAARAG
jgi:protein-L-isoaspartate O-methyltransferase